MPSTTRCMVGVLAVQERGYEVANYQEMELGSQNSIFDEESD